ncbi:GHMP kinase [Flavobacterium sp. CYK-4]|uniref:GYDIA family GHMP kinase n=1 Tax=Flavobacterium lotistagni TaxID=2709660 RepID=UPI00140A9409|nr:GYDIA family GHMP kinase [Flavobacterium lotistagni]NHM05837.1 GHMP kinase [Flavobacterium lotistagni]
MKKTFYSNGKLLLTSEYLVLDGAKALALPTKFGQNLTIEPGNNKEIQWTSYDDDGSFWLEETFAFETITNQVFSENQPVKNMLITILYEAYQLNPAYLNDSEGYTITTQLTFPKSWGLGTSSTLINNIAQWLEIDAYTLLARTFLGSGYDIACAQNNSPILYQLVQEKPWVELVDFKPECASNIYFLYLNQKQNSQNAVKAYRSKSNDLKNLIPIFNQLTETVLQHHDFESLKQVIEQHEKQMTEILDLPRIQQALFADFEGTIKSLGAWGGDFALVLSRKDPSPYFIEKGYETLLRYQDMIL